jgi:hypothetical protein
VGLGFLALLLRFLDILFLFRYLAREIGEVVFQGLDGRLGLP